MFAEGHIWEILILLVIVLLVFGPGKLPEVGSALGRGIREFKDATNGTQESSRPPMIGQTPPARPLHEPQQWQQAPSVEQREPVAAEPTIDERPAQYL